MRAFVLAIVIGLVAATAASLFMWVVDGGQEFVYKTLPESFGWEKLPGWWVLLLLLVGAVLVHVARRLPGATGGSPLSGFHFTNPISWAPSILLAALGTLVFGASLGPEGPLIVLGSAVAAILVKRANSDDITKLAMLLGGMAAIGTIFGNPFVAAFMLLEFAAMGAVPSAALVPAFVSLGAGYVTLVGWGSWTGFGVHVLSVPGLPAYDSLEPDDLFAGLIVAVIVSVLAALARELGERTDLLSTKRPTAYVRGRRPPRRCLGGDDLRRVLQPDPLLRPERHGHPVAQTSAGAVAPSSSASCRLRHRPGRRLPRGPSSRIGVGRVLASLVF
jgi:H+/Cl- antiporter ClcA